MERMGPASRERTIEVLKAEVRTSLQLSWSEILSFLPRRPP